MQAKAIKLLYTDKEIEIHLTLDWSNETIQKVSKLKEITDKGKLLDVKMKQHRKRRSLDANAYCFILCDKIAKVIGNTKEYVYKEAIKQVGTFEIVPIKNEAVKKWIINWESKGLGWQSCIHGKSKIDGYTNTINYYGSSTYTSLEMSVLLGEIIYQAKELEIETMTPKEQEEIIRLTYKEE